jgi:hypothetical protein
MSWKLEKISASVYRIARGRDRAGHVLAKDGLFNGKIEVEGQTVTAERAATAGDAFREVVAQANRILICGENDAVKAAAVLKQQTEAHNESVRRTADDLNYIAEQMGKAPVVTVRRRRRRMPRI